MSLSQTEWRNNAGTMKVITATWVAETSGSFTSANITGCRGMYLYQIRTIPNAGRAPTADYDITITDSDSVDVAGGLLADRSASSTEDVLLTQIARPVISDLTLNITGNAVDRATGQVKLFLSPEPFAIVAAAAE
jgi:hypothetical protein